MSGITWRPYRGPDDLAGMVEVEARLRERLGLTRGINLAAMEHQFAHLVNSDPLTDCLVAERDGVTTGYTRTEWHDLVEDDRVHDITTVVDPDAWGLGIADALLAWSEERLGGIARTLPRDRRCWYTAYAYDGDAESVAALEGRGYEAVRWDAEMVRPDLTGTPTVELPDGYLFRTPEEHELPAVFELMVATFAEHWGEYDAGDQRFDDWAGDPRFRRDLVAVAWLGDTPVACLTSFIEPAPDGSVRGYLESLATRPGHRRRGLGRAAMAESLRLLREAGATSAWLGVDTDNPNKALALYEDCGFRVVTHGATYRKPLEPQATRAPGGPPMSAITTGIPELALRPGTAADWDAMAEALNRARRADGVEEVRTGASLAADHVESQTFHVERDVLIAELDGNLVGFCMGSRVRRDGVPVAESWGIVVPEHRRRGIGTTLFRANRERVVADHAADPGAGPGEMRSYALDDEAGARALLVAEGFVAIRYGFEMRRYLTGALPAHSLPDGLEMRPVTPDQHRAIFDADNEAFEDHWGRRTPNEADFQAEFQGPDVDTSLWCIAWDRDRVAGVVMNAIYHGENEALGIRRGWLEHVSVRRPWRGRGVAKALCAASFRVLRDQGMDEAWLGVDGSNPTGAVRLYEGLGFGVVRQWKAYGRPIEGPAPAGWRPAGPLSEA